MNKNIIYSIAIALFATLFTSCDGFLTEEPQDTLNEGNAFTDYQDAENLIMACYDGLQKGFEEYYTWYYLIISEALADNAYSGGDDIDIINMGNKNVNSLNQVALKSWKSLYGGILRCNTALRNIPNIQDARLDQPLNGDIPRREEMLAEAYFIRALHYYNLVKTYGRVPLVITTGSVAPEDIYVPKVDDENEIYEQIFSDLTIALKSLPESRSTAAKTRGLATKGAVNALFAKAYSMKGAPSNIEWDKVKQYSEAVLTSSEYALLSTFDHLFDDQHRNNSETILAVQYMAGSQEANYAPIMLLPPSLSGQNWRKYLIPSQSLIKAFDDSGDAIRKHSTVLYEDIDNIWFDEYYSVLKDGQWHTGSIPFAYKWRASNRSGWDCSDLLYIFRLGDIALLHAEALNQVDGYAVAAASPYLNQIRTRAGLGALNPSSKTEMISLLLNERRLELAYEGERFFDLKRYGQVKKVIENTQWQEVVNNQMTTLSSTFPEHMINLPIPQDELDRNPALVQHEGY